MSGLRTHGEHGAAAVEYVVLIAGLAIALIIGVSAVAGGLSTVYCHAWASLAAGGSCVAAPIVTPANDPPSAPDAKPTPTPTEAPTPSFYEPPASDGWMVFYTAVVDQANSGVCLNCLSIRTNVGWQPNSWMNVTYPQVATVDVWWDPALTVHSINPGSNGTWTVAVSEPGHARLVRQGQFDPLGWHPEPEILLDKPAAQQQNVTVTITVHAANATPITATRSTTSIRY